MGSSNSSDYRNQIDQGLAQANLPKSPLAQQYSNLFGNASPELMHALMNVQNLGNSFVNSNGANSGGSNFSPTGPANDAGGGGGGGQGGVSTNQNGMPNGVSIPGVQGANPDTSGLSGAVDNSNSMLQQILGMNPGSLQSIGQNNGANLSMNNPMQQIQQLLSGIGGGYQNVQTPNVNNPNFMQQLLQPQNVQANFNPQMAQPGQVNTNFNASQADLSGVPNSTQLSPQNSQGMDAITQILNQQNTKNIADMRESALQQGTARSTGQQYGEATYRAQEAPQLAAALENVRNQEVGNQLNQAGLQQQGLLANAGMQNQYGLGGAQLGANTQLQNIQNYLNSIGQNNQAGLGAASLNANTGLQNQQNQMNAGNLNNLTALQARGQDVGTSLANASNAINVGQGNQAAGLNYQGMNNSLLNNLMGNQTNQNSLNLQNFFNTIGANQNQMGIQNQFGNSNVNANNSLASLLSNLSQFNAGQGNAYNLGVGQMNQQSSQSMIQNQLAQLAMLFQGGLGMASQGIPGGSANINVTNQQPQGGGVGGTLGGIGSILNGLAGFR